MYELCTMLGSSMCVPWSPAPCSYSDPPQLFDPTAPSTKLPCRAKRRLKVYLINMSELKIEILTENKTEIPSPCGRRY